MRMRRENVLVLGLVLASAVVGCGGAEVREPEGERPNDPLVGVPGDTLFQTGVTLADQGDYVRAEQYLAAAMAQGYDEVRSLRMLMRVCVAASRMRAALSYAQPVLARRPHDWSLRQVVASIRLAIGDTSGARRDLERVVRDAPDEPGPRYLLAVVLRDSGGDRAAAAEHFERYLELLPDGEHADEARSALEAQDAPVPAPGAATETGTATTPPRRPRRGPR